MLVGKELEIVSPDIRQDCLEMHYSIMGRRVQDYVLE